MAQKKYATAATITKGMRASSTALKRSADSDSLRRIGKGMGCCSLMAGSYGGAAGKAMELQNCGLAFVLAVGEEASVPTIEPARGGSNPWTDRASGSAGRPTLLPVPNLDPDNQTHYDH